MCKFPFNIDDILIFPYPAERFIIFSLSPRRERVRVRGIKNL